MKKKLYYFSSDMGCGIRAGYDEEKVEDRIIREVGTVHEIQEFREATPKDLGWVKAMGGYIPTV